MQVFLSHSNDDIDFVDRLAKNLREEGLDCWMAPESILPGESWVKAIERGLRESEYLLLILSPSALESEWVDIELTTGIRLERQGKITIIPIEHKDCDVPLLLGNYQFINFKVDYDTALKTLLNRLGIQQKLLNLAGHWQDPSSLSERKAWLGLRAC